MACRRLRQRIARSYFIFYPRMKDETIFHPLMKDETIFQPWMKDESDFHSRMKDESSMTHVVVRNPESCIVSYIA